MLLYYIMGLSRFLTLMKKINNILVDYQTHSWGRKPPENGIVKFVNLLFLLIGPIALRNFHVELTEIPTKLVLENNAD